MTDDAEEEEDEEESADEESVYSVEFPFGGLSTPLVFPSDMNNEWLFVLYQKNGLLLLLVLFRLVSSSLIGCSVVIAVMVTLLLTADNATNDRDGWYPETTTNAIGAQLPPRNEAVVPDMVAMTSNQLQQEQQQ